MMLSRSMMGIMMCLLMSLLLCVAEENEEGVQSVHFILRNELPEPVELYFEAEGERIRQDKIDANGGQLVINAFPGHIFSYEYGKEVHFVGVQDGSEGEVFQVLLANKDEVLVRCSVVDEEDDEPLNIIVRPSWSPRGASRFLELVRIGYFNGVALNRVVPKFLTQFGISPNHEQRHEYGNKNLPDDPPAGIKFEPGMLSYAGGGPDTRTTEVFVVMPDTEQSQLNYFGINPWETPFGYVPDVEDSPVARWHAYGDMPPWGEGPDSSKIYEQDGYEYLEREFPELDYLGTCVIVQNHEFGVDEL
jgi:peptidyl-prolyl cis-trans isomerase A (cyclophilin A)